MWGRSLRSHSFPLVFLSTCNNGICVIIKLRDEVQIVQYDLKKDIIYGHIDPLSNPQRASLPLPRPSQTDQDFIFAISLNR